MKFIQLTIFHLDTPFDLGVSYCYSRKISNELLDIPKIGFVNYHPGPML